ncbi:MAG TPA: hypothetical protein VFF68_08915, partial [Anaerolineaceae bacterium]|nr:hypothetical protein [Anaerolineaceae bacterium]
RLPEQWASDWPAVEAGAVPPQRGSWRIARMVLEDAAWQSMQSTLTPEQIPGLLMQLDATVREVGQQLGYGD